LFLANVDFAVMPENQTNLSPAGEENGWGPNHSSDEKNPFNFELRKISNWFVLENKKISAHRGNAQSPQTGLSRGTVVVDGVWWTGWPAEFGRKIAINAAQPIFCHNDCITFSEYKN
jgi:hypothetical protein